MSELEKLLIEKKYEYHIENGVIIVTHKGHLSLGRLTTITATVFFENLGYVHLDNAISITTRGKTLTLKTVDGYTMIINSSKRVDDFTIYKAQYMGGGELEDLKKCYIAEKDGYFAHGETIRDAIEDVNFKFIQATFDLKNLYRK